MSVDSSLNAINIGKSKYKLDNLKFILANALDVKFNEKFDAGISLYFLSLFEKEEAKKIIKNMLGSLKGSGDLVVNFLSIHDDEYGTGKKIKENTFLHEDGPLIRFYSKKEIENLFLELNLKFSQKSVCFS